MKQVGGFITKRWHELSSLRQESAAKNASARGKLAEARHKATGLGARLETLEKTLKALTGALVEKPSDADTESLEAVEENLAKQQRDFFDGLNEKMEERYYDEEANASATAERVGATREAALGKVLNASADVEAVKRWPARSAFRPSANQSR